MNSEPGIYQEVIEKPDFKGIPNILIVEDDEYCAMLISEFLAETNYLLTIASDGEKALELCKSKKYDLVLLDIQLPKIDGFQVARQIKLFNPELPIITITAAVIDYSLVKECGIDMVIEKPISYYKLLNSISQYF